MKFFWPVILAFMMVFGVVAYIHAAGAFGAGVSAGGGVADGAVTSAKIANDSIVNEDIKTDAAIAVSKLGTGGTIPANSGVNLTALNATNLTSGTVPDARFPATLPVASGVNLTALNASNLGSGTIPDARFPATLPAISGANLTNLPESGGGSNENSYSWFCEFLGSGASLAGDIQWNGLNINGGSNSLIGASVAGRPGIVSATIDTTANSTAGLTGSALTTREILFGAGAFTYNTGIRLSALSDATDTYVIRIGFMENNTNNTEGADGAFFRYTHGTNGGEWEAVTRSNDTETATDSNAAATADWAKLTVEMNAAGTSCVFKIDGAIVATNTTNIPTGAGRDTSFGFKIVRTSGSTNSRRLDVDWIKLTFIPSSTR